MSSLTKSRNLFTKYQLPLFFLLSYLLSWWFMVTRLGQLPQGVAFAAIIVIALTVGRKGLREYWGRLKRFRTGWLLIGPAIILGYKLVGLLITVLFGSEFVLPPSLPWIDILILVFFGGQWEEPGWSGYALPTLQKRFAKNANGPLFATLIVGVF